MRKRLNGTHEETILRYVPAVREALEERQRKRASAIPGQSEA
jgi:hypothetical protein